MSGTAIGSFSDFLNWNGNGDAHLTASFTVTSLQTPIPITSAIWFNAQGNTITIDVATNFSGLFQVRANVIPTFQNMIVNVSATTMTYLQTSCGCILSQHYVETTNVYNPQCHFIWCSVTLAGNMTKNYTGGYIGKYDQQSTGQFTFTQCKVSCLDILGQRCGGFVGTYNSEAPASANRLCTFTFTKCYSITQNLKNDNTSAFCGKLHSTTVTFDQCIARTIFNNSANVRGGFFTAENSVTATITNCYLLYECYITGNAWWNIPGAIAYFRYNTSTLSVTNFYVLPMNNTNGYISEYNYAGRTSSTTNSDGNFGVTLNYCAFPVSSSNFVRTYNATYSNVIYTYTATSASNTSPFTNFSSSQWSSVTTTSPLILKAFTQTPFSGYTVYNSSVTSVPCFLQGTKLLLADGVTWKSVEELQIGDALHVHAIIKNISISYVIDDSSDPICIPRDFFAPNTPWEDLYLSPWHAILHPLTGKWVHVQHLQNTPCHDKKPVFVYYMIETYCSDDVVNAHGIIAETFGPPHLWDCFPEKETCIKQGPLCTDTDDADAEKKNLT